VLQFRARRHVPWTYWFAVAIVSVFGTMATDVAHVGPGVPYLASTACVVAVLAVIFTAWHGTEETLSMNSIQGLPMHEHLAAESTLGDRALEIRSKNVGPFWMTVEALMKDDVNYRLAGRRGHRSHPLPLSPSPCCSSASPRS
jgi:hypothetical protein